MVKNTLNIVFLLAGFVTLCQECPGISYPADGDTGIPVDAAITWPAVDAINGYLISIGTTPGGVDIANARPIGQATSYTPPVGLPENAQIFVSISLVLFDGPPVACPGIMFHTMDVTTPPPCTLLIAPDNDAFNVTIVSDLVWAYASTATYYRVSMGTSPGGVELLNNLKVGNVLTYEPPGDLPQDTRIYVRITPFNENGAPSSCMEESFFTGPEVDYCEPVVNETTGETRSLRPEISFPDEVGICSGDLPYIVRSEDQADGFRWYRTNSGSPETLLSQNREVPITEEGRYRYEAYNTVGANGNTIECSSSKLFTVVVSEIATIRTIDIVNMPGGREITIFAEGMGLYEYALDDVNGPYQDSPVFSNTTSGFHIAYVRDKNGCGTVERTVDRDLTSEDFPNFFTPNGDGINDYWQINPPSENTRINLETIFIFDRYGSLLAQINPESQGWDGKVRGNPQPSSNYWFKASVPNGPEIRGYFALKR